MLVAIVGRSAQASGSECVLFGNVDVASHRFAPVTAKPAATGSSTLKTFGDWELRPMRPSDALERAPALVAVNAPGPHCRTFGRLVLVAHRWSGVLQIDDIGRKYKVDLFSELTRLVLLDVVHEILLDVTQLAAVRDGALELPDLPPEKILSEIVESGAWFRFLETDPGYRPSPARRVIEAFRDRPGRDLKARIVERLLPRLSARPAPVAIAPPEPQPAPALASDAERLRDEIRFVAAAVEGLVLRVAAEG